MKTSSAKAKGRRLQQLVRNSLRARYVQETTGMVDEDIESRQMGGTGTDIVLSPLAKKYIKFDFECKNTETASPWAWMKQAKENTTTGRKPCVVFTRNHEDTYVLIKFEDFVELM